MQTKKSKKIVIDPEPQNTRAIKSYQKAGFKHVKTTQISGKPQPTYLMELSCILIIFWP